MKITELILQTSNVWKLYDFYSNTLQLRVSRESETEFVIVTSGTILRIKQSVDLAQPFYHFAFNIPSNKIEEAGAWLRQKVGLLWMDDYKSHIADFVNWHAKSVYFLDPAGNIVELIARFDLNDNVAEHFAPSHIRNVSELGVVFPAKNFNETVEKFMQQYELVYFKKQSPLPQFRAVGNDKGLFIIVPEDRAWFPTKDTRARIFPMQVSFATENGKHIIQL